MFKHEIYKKIDVIETISLVGLRSNKCAGWALNQALDNPSEKVCVIISSLLRRCSGNTQKPLKISAKNKRLASW